MFLDAPCTIGARLSTVVAALPAVFLAATPAQPVAAAAPTPVTVVNPVENRDEPARHRYQEWVHGAGSDGPAEITFTTVPANRLLVVVHVNCIVLVRTGHHINLVEMHSKHNGFDGPTTEILPSIGTPVTAFGQVSTVFGDEPQLYYKSGDAPMISAFADDPNPILNCRLSGYEVNLP
jgi:hypothetical protein